MKRAPQTRYTGRTVTGPAGFTLVEIIVTLMAAGILGAIFIQFMGAALDGGWEAVETVRDEAGCEEAMEAIIADYVKFMNSDPRNALASVFSTYNGLMMNGNLVTTQYTAFENDGSELDPLPPISYNLKVTVQGANYELIAILSESRDTDDPLIRY